MLERVIYTVLVLGGAVAAYALAEHFGLINGREVVSQNKEEGDKHE